MSGILFRNFDFVKAVKRFWPAILFAIAGTVAAILMVEFEHGLDRSEFKILLSSWAGMLVFINLQLIRESFKLELIKFTGLSFVALAFIALLYYSLPVHDDLFTIPKIYRYLGLILLLHLLVSVIPHFTSDKIDAFWQYNRKLLLLKIESLFNSGALYLGLTLALLALKFLFNLDINDDIFLYTFMAILGVFNTCYFLSRFPVDMEDQDIKVPSKGYSVFSQFILIPLNLIYILILYAYGVKILFEQNLPKGWVSNLVLWFSVLGVLAYLLNYYNPRFSDNTLTRLFKKWFFYILPAPLILLFVAIYTRLSEYGVTENRYIVAGLGVWLSFLCVYFIVSKKDNIKMIPKSLIVFIILAIVGPWDMMNASRRSQSKRVLEMMKQHELFDGNKFIPPIDTMGHQKNYKLINQLNYLEKRDQLDFLNQFEPFSNGGNELISNKEQYDSNPEWKMDYVNSKKIAEVLNMDYRGVTKRAWLNERNINLRSDWNEETLDIAGYNKAINFHAYASGTESSEDKPVIVNDSKDKILLRVESEDFEISVDSIILPHIYDNLVEEKLEAEQLSYKFSGERVEGKIYFNSLHAYRDEGSIEMGSANGILIYRLKTSDE